MGVAGVDVVFVAPFVAVLVFEAEEDPGLDEGKPFAEILALAFTFLFLDDFDCETSTTIC